MAQSLLSSMRLARTSVLMHAVADHHTTDSMQLQLINFDLVIFFYWIFGRPVSLGGVPFPLIIIKIWRRQVSELSGSSLPGSLAALSLGLTGIFELILFHFAIEIYVYDTW
ncbi:hypothetical protein BDR07DRAFT_798822 [Suillus spraguei]|nr:hypothetical protein BDR07DRAFT_798822 [Suillus spraguei]